MEFRFEYITQEGCRIEEPWQKSQLAAIATPPPTYQLCNDAEALCLASKKTFHLRYKERNGPKAVREALTTAAA